MNRIAISFLFLFPIWTLLSCSSDENQDSADNTELLIMESPWSFLRFEVENIIDNDGFDLVESDISSVENQRFDGQIIQFSSDGTGTATANQLLEFNWEIMSANRLTISNGYIYNLTFDLSISDTQMILTSESFTFQYQDSSTGRFGELIFAGRIFFE